MSSEAHTNGKILTPGKAGSIKLHLHFVKPKICNKAKQVLNIGRFDLIYVANKSNKLKQYLSLLTKIKIVDWITCFSIR